LTEVLARKGFKKRIRAEDLPQGQLGSEGGRQKGMRRTSLAQGKEWINPGKIGTCKRKPGRLYVVTSKSKKGTKNGGKNNSV